MDKSEKLTYRSCFGELGIFSNFGPVGMLFVRHWRFKTAKLFPLLRLYAQYDKEKKNVWERSDMKEQKQE